LNLPHLAHTNKFDDDTIPKGAFKPKPSIIMILPKKY
jgi:hypothetical protein